MNSRVDGAVVATGSDVRSGLVSLETLDLSCASSSGEAVNDSRKELGVNLWMQVNGSHV